VEDLQFPILNSHSTMILQLCHSKLVKLVVKAGDHVSSFMVLIAA